MEQLTEGLRQGARFVLISAPPGYGKTTLLSDWCASPYGRAWRIAWLSLDEDNNDLIQFLRYVVAALEKAEILIGANTRALLEAPQPVAPRVILTSLINDLNAMVSPVLLVMDDYQFIESAAIHEAITFVLDHLPANFQLIIASRSDPPLPLARWRTRGQIHEIRASDLQFTLAETVSFLKQTMELQLEEGDIAVLNQRTEGWIASLQLAALSMRHRSNLADFVRAFTGSNRLVFQYLADEVLKYQPEAIQQFLVQISILDRFCGPLCDALARRTDSQPLLERLYASELFMLALDEDGCWYRFHHLFRDFLSQKLMQTAPAQVSQLHRRAAAWFENQQLLPEAIQHALAIPDYDLAVRLIIPIGMAMIQRGEQGLLRRWLDVFPESMLAANPELCYLSAWLYLFTGQIERYEPPLLAAEGAWRAAGNDIKLGQVLDQRAHFARLQGKGEAAIDLARHALHYLPEADRFDRASSLLALAEGYILLGNFVMGSRYAQEASEMARMSDNVIVEALSLRVLGTMHLMQGRLHAAAERFEGVLRLTATKPIWQRVEAHIGLASIYYEWNDLTIAADHLNQAEAVSDPGRREVYFAPGYLAIARLAWVQVDRERTETYLALAQTAAERLGNPTQMGEVKAWLARLQPVSQRPADCGDISSRSIPEQLSLLPRWVQEGQGAEAVPHLQRLLDADEAAGRMARVIEILSLMAIAYHSLDQAANAITALDQALALAEPEGFVRIFVDQGAPMMQLLRQSLLRGTAIAYIRRVLAAFPLPLQANDHVYPADVNSDIVPIDGLNDRERVILRLIAQGLSNRDIADHLAIAPSTVKWYINSLYGKLNVRSRTQAIARALELRLFDP